MTGILITGQLEPVKPLAVRSWFMRQGEGDLAALKTIADAFPVPSHALSGGGTIASRRAEMTDDQIELTIRDWIWRNIYYTGTDIGGTPVTNSRALDIYNWLQTNAALNGGKGPEIGCGSVHDMWIGFLAAYGIPARRSWQCHGSLGADFAGEYWSPAAAGWVHVGAHVNYHTEWVATGKGASLLDAVTVYRQLGNVAAAAVITQHNDGASTGKAFKNTAATGDVTTYNDGVRWGRGSRRQFAGGVTGDPNVTDDGNVSINLVRFLPDLPAMTGAQHLAADGTSVAARDVSDVNFTPSALMARASVTSRGLVVVALDATMLDPVSKYQYQAPGSSTWTDLLDRGHSFYPVAGQAWKYRAVGPLGNTTNTVTVTAT